MGRSTVFKGSEEPTEFFLNFFIAEVKKLKDLGLNITVMDTNGTAAKLYTV